MGEEQPVNVAYGWLAALPKDYGGPRHRVELTRKQITPHLAWVTCEERPGPEPHPENRSENPATLPEQLA